MTSLTESFLTLFCWFDLNSAENPTALSVETEGGGGEVTAQLKGCCITSECVCVGGGRWGGRQTVDCGTERCFYISQSAALSVRDFPTLLPLNSFNVSVDNTVGVTV